MFDDYTPTELVLVDCETSGRDFERHEAVEVAWINHQTRERGRFVPAHNVSQMLGAAEPGALRVNRYIERGLWEYECWDVDYREQIRLWEQFVGPLYAPIDAGPPPKRIFVAVNPAFDAHFVSKLFARGRDVTDGDPEPWHYRLRDLGSYAAGVLSLPLDHPPLSFREICELLGVAPGDHTAAGDVTAMDACLTALAEIAEACTREPEPDELGERETASAVA